MLSARLGHPHHHRDDYSGFSPPQYFVYENLLARGIGIPREDKLMPHQHNDPDDYVICCTDDLVQQAKCEERNTAIINKTQYKGDHLQWTIPVGQSQVSPDQLATSALT